MSKVDYFKKFKVEISNYLNSLPLNKKANIDKIYNEAVDIFDTGLFDESEKIPLHMSERRLRQICEASNVDKEMCEKIVFRLSREIEKHLRRSRLAYKSNPNYYSDWIPVLAFFGIAIYLLRVKNNTNHNLPSNSVIGVRA